MPALTLKLGTWFHQQGPVEYLYVKDISLTPPDSLGHAVVGLLKRSLEIPVLISHVQIRLAAKAELSSTKKRGSKGSPAKHAAWLEKVASVAAKVSLHAPVVIQDISVADKVAALLFEPSKACRPAALSDPPLLRRKHALASRSRRSPAAAACGQKPSRSTRSRLRILCVR